MLRCIYLLVFFRRIFPAEIAFHCRFAHSGEVFRAVEIGAYCPADGVEDRIGGEVVEFKSGPAAGRFVILRYRVGKAACVADDRQSAVFERVDLVEPARLVA